MDFTRFEKLYGASPYVLRDRHPNGSLVVMQAYAQLPSATSPSPQVIKEAAIKVMKKMNVPVTPENLAMFGVKEGPITEPRLRSAVWDEQSGALLWAPENTIAMAWLHHGTQIALLRERYDYQPEMHKILGSPLQSEFTYTWERRTWPRQELISSCSLTMPTGWPVTLVTSPHSDLAAFQWLDQSEGGLEFLALSEQGDVQLMQTGLPILESVTDLCFRSDGNGFPLGSNLMSPPAFSPDGRYLVVAWQQNWEWWIDESNNPLDPSILQSVCQIGYVEVLDWEDRHVWEVAITTVLLPGWPPSDLDDEVTASLFLHPPLFIDDEHFTLLLPTKEIKTYSVHEERPIVRIIKASSQSLSLREYEER